MTEDEELALARDRFLMERRFAEWCLSAEGSAICTYVTAILGGDLTAQQVARVAVLDEFHHVWSTDAIKNHILWADSVVNPFYPGTGAGYVGLDKLPRISDLEDARELISKKAIPPVEVPECRDTNR